MDGDPMKPTLNITATENVKTAVASSETHRDASWISTAA